MVAWGCGPVGMLFHLHLHLRVHLRLSTSSPSGATVEFLQLLCNTLPGDLPGVCLPPLGLRQPFPHSSRRFGGHFRSRGGPAENSPDTGDGGHGWPGVKPVSAKPETPRRAR